VQLDVRISLDFLQKDRDLDHRETIVVIFIAHAQKQNVRFDRQYDDDYDERIDFTVTYSPKIAGTHNSKKKCQQ